MTPKTWQEMVNGSRRLEKSLGDGIKKLKRTKINSFIVQESVYAKKIKKKSKIKKRND